MDGSIVGKRFGRLVVQQRVEGQLVLAKCDCGRYALVAQYNLERHASTTCCQCNDLAEERFWANVDKSGGPDACWPWKGKLNDDGYGRFHRGYGDEIASKMAWELANKQIIVLLPEYREVMHSCDNRPCCNPKHLSLGTREENLADRHRKGRSASGDDHGRRVEPAAYAHLVGDSHWRHDPTKADAAATGERHGMAKLSQEQAERVRMLYLTRPDLTQEKIGEMVGVCQAHVSDIVTGKLWTELNDGGKTPREIRKAQQTAARETRDAAILADLAAGVKHTDICKKHNVSRMVLERLRGKGRYASDEPSGT